MRKIISRHEEKRKRRMIQVWLSIILIFIMFSSILGFAFQTFGGHLGNRVNGEENIPETTNFNGFEFSEQSEFWVLNLNGINLIFRYNPSQIIKLNAELNPLLNYEAKSLYIYSESAQAKSEIKTNLFKFVDGIENACLEGIKNCEGPIKTCEENFIIIEESENREIKQQNNCVFIKGKKEDLVKLTDEFLYKIFGVA